MPSFMDKLNVLVKSSIHGVLGGDTPHPRQQVRLGKGIDREVAALRRQIEEALNDEDRMTAEIQAAQEQIDSWDQQADQALGRGDEATARHAVRQMQLQQQRQTMLQADLAQHRFSTSELIQRVNELEAVVAEARRHQQQQAAETKDEGTDDDSLSARLRSAMQQVAPHTAPSSEAKGPTVVSEKAVEDDLAQRRARLSQ